MGLLQKAVETYDTMAYRAGKIYAEENEPLAPLSHSLTRAQIEITLDQDGTFLSARTVDKNEPKIIIPVTEESAGRTSKAAAERPHPLCDYLKYLLPHNETEYSHYLTQLSLWANSEHSTPKLKAILHYVKSGTILADLTASNVLKLGSDGAPTDEKLLVCWVVNGLGEGLSGPCWTDRALMDSFSSYYASRKESGLSSLCMISGRIEPQATQHPKGVVPINGNAKLISSNDSKGFTYRGRFSDGWQAATVSYVSSQQAHNALRWLIANQSVSFGGRTFLCWNPQGHPVPPVHGPMARGKATRRAATPTQYRRQLQEALSGWKTALPAQDGVVVTAFDAATTGRLAVTYYNELTASDLLDRLYAWDSTCCWEHIPYGIQSPTLFQIVNLAFGTLRNGRAETDDRIIGPQMQRLISCRIDRAPFPPDIEQNLAERASHLALYEDHGKVRTRTDLLFTACAVIRKYRYDHLKEEWDMALDRECTDRSYLFGRLLAIAEAVEQSTYSAENIRETNALRMQKAFALRPMASWRILEERLAPYYRQLSPRLRNYYRKLTQEVIDKLDVSAPDLNQKLEDIYLLGYYHQRAYRNERSNGSETEM